MMKLLTIILLLPLIVYAQQPSTGGNATNYPLYGVNARWTNGVAPGYYPTKGSGLTLNVGAGTANCSGTRVAYAGSTLTMTNNATNYVFLDSTASCAPASNTTGYPSTYWIATVTTSGGVITAIQDDRTFFFAGGSGSASGGAVVKTTNYTFASSDNGKLIVMNCSSACTLTFNGSPAATDFGWIASIGSTTATISLNSKNFNGSSSIPVFNKYEVIYYASDGSNYFGDPPSSAGSGIAFTPASNAFAIATNLGTSNLPSAHTYRVCMMNAGADNGAVLVDADLGQQKRRCFIPVAAHIVEVTVSADAGTPNILLQRRRGNSTVADLLSGALATASSGNVACARSSTSATCIDGTTSSSSITTSNTAILAGDYIEYKSGTAGGTAKSMQVAVTLTID